MYILLIIIVLGILACWSRPAALKKAGDHSINVLEQVEVGGIKQWISIRGTDVNNPILLFLHGGPGSANLAKIRIQCPELEEHFVVVTWDQRGAGKSYTAWFNGNAPTVMQLRSDTHEMVQYLRQRFDGRKVYLMGFSWGSILGLWTAHDYPEDIAAYIGVGQEVDLRQAEEQSLALLRQVVAQAGDEIALQELSTIDPSYHNADWYTQLMIERKWLLKYGGVYATTNNYNHEALMLLKAPEYSFVDFAFWPWASAKSLKTLWPDVMQVNMFRDVPEIDVPVYFIVGQQDANSPASVTAAYFEAVHAPQGKQLIRAEHAAHDVFFDNPEVITDTLLALLNE